MIAGIPVEMGTCLTRFASVMIHSGMTQNEGFR